MQTQKSVDKLIAEYGTIVELGDIEPVTTSALIHPLRRRDQSLFSGDYSRLGICDARHFIYIGPAQYSLTGRRDESVRAGECVYRIIRAEDVCVFGKPVYSWGLLRLEDGAD